jgi:hypothetical protein
MCCREEICNFYESLSNNVLIFGAALAHERLSPPLGMTLSDDEMSEIVHETRIDLSVWLRYETENGMISIANFG